MDVKGSLSIQTKRSPLTIIPPLKIYVKSFLFHCLFNLLVGCECDWGGFISQCIGFLHVSYNSGILIQTKSRGSGSNFPGGGANFFIIFTILIYHTIPVFLYKLSRSKFPGGAFFIIFTILIQQLYKI